MSFKFLKKSFGIAEAFVGSMFVLLTACAGSHDREPVVSVVPEQTETVAEEESFLTKALEDTLPELIAQRESWQNYRYGLEAIENEEWLAASHYFDVSLKNFIEERKDSILTSKADLDYNSSFLQKLLAASDEVYPKLSELGEDAETYNTYEFTFEGIEETGASADSASLVIIENFLDTLDLNQFSLPLELNERVLQEIYYFTEVVPSFINSSLTRKTAYDSLIYGILHEYEMPEDLIFLSLVESGFKVRAYSRAKASGLWQFIPATGERYGLKSNFWVDMRRNPEKATRAAAAYLTYLHSEFDDWLLAMAAYNCGEGRVRRLIREKMADSTWEEGKKVTYWDLQLPKETMHYVPRILAAMVIGHFPEHYGIEVKQTYLAEYDTVTVTDCLPLSEISRALKISEDSVRALNMELIKWSTPPDMPEYQLRIPPGTRDKFIAAYDKMDKNKFPRWHYHKVKRGESLGAIAKQYGVKMGDIQDANQMKKSTRLKAGQQLLIPLPPSASGNGGVPSKKAADTRKTRIYTVQEGDNQASVSRRYGISVVNLRRWNNLDQTSQLQPGQELFVSEPVSDGNAVVEARKNEPTRVIKNGMYEVQSGDTYASIANAFNVYLEDLMSMNNASRRRLKVGQSLKIPEKKKTAEKKIEKTAEKKKAEKTTDSKKKDNKTKETPKKETKQEKSTVYTVKSGDNLSSISKKTNISMTNLMLWNGLASADKIFVGQKLKLEAPAKQKEQAKPAKTDKKDAKKQAKRTHTVRKGESLWDIAKKYGVTIENIVKWNNLNGTRIQTGQTLQVEK